MRSSRTNRQSRFEGLWFKVEGFRVKSLGFRVWGLGFRVQGLAFKAGDLGGRHPNNGGVAHVCHVYRDNIALAERLRREHVVPSISARVPILRTCDSLVWQWNGCGNPAKMRILKMLSTLQQVLAGRKGTELGPVRARVVRAS